MPKGQPTPTSSTRKPVKERTVVEHGAERMRVCYDTDTDREDIERMKNMRFPNSSSSTQRPIGPVNLPALLRSRASSPNPDPIAPPQPSAQNGSEPGNNVGDSPAAPSINGSATRSKRHRNPEPSTSQPQISPSTRRTRRSNGAALLNGHSAPSSSAIPATDEDQDRQPGPSPYSNPTGDDDHDDFCAPGPSTRSNPTNKSVHNHHRSSSGESERNGSPASKRMRRSNNSSSSPHPTSSAKRTRDGTQSPNMPSTSASSSGEDNERHGSAKIPEYRERGGRKSGSASRKSQEVPMETSDPDSGISSGSSRESSGPSDSQFKVPLLPMRSSRNSPMVTRESSAAPSNRSSRASSVVSSASIAWNHPPQETRSEWLLLLDQLRRDPSDNEKAIIVAKIERIRRNFTEVEMKEFEHATEYFKYHEHRRANSVSIMAPINSRQVSEEPDDDDMEDPYRVSPLGRMEEDAVVEEEEERDEEEKDEERQEGVGNEMHHVDEGGDNDEPKNKKILNPIELVASTDVLEKNFTRCYWQNDPEFVHLGTDRRHCSIPLDRKAPRTMFIGREKEFVQMHATKPDCLEPDETAPPSTCTEVYPSTLKPAATRKDYDGDVHGIFTEERIPEAREEPADYDYCWSRREQVMWVTPSTSLIERSLRKMNPNLIKKMREEMKKPAEEGEEPTKEENLEDLFFELLKIVYIRPIWQQFRGHIPIDFALQKLMENNYEFGVSLDNVDLCLNDLPQQPPTLCTSQAKGMHKWLYTSVPFEGNSDGDLSPKMNNERHMLQLKSTRNFFPAEISNMSFQFHRYFQYHRRFGVPCNCKEWLCEEIPFEPRYSCGNCSQQKLGTDKKRLCLICQTYRKWFGKNRPAKKTNFTSFETDMMEAWRNMNYEKKCILDREQFEEELKKARENEWRAGKASDEEKLMINMEELWATGDESKTSDEKKEFIYQELQPFELPHYTKCNCIQSGRFPNGSRNIVFKEKDKREFLSALQKEITIEKAAAHMNRPVDHVWLFLHRFGREKPMWKRVKPEKLDKIFGRMPRLSTHLPPILPVPMEDQRDYPRPKYKFY